MQNEPRERLVTLFQGNVQGVGFRFRTLELAAGFEVVGYVQNMDDGRVRLVVEGARGSVIEFVDKLHRSLARFIARSDQTREPASGEFSTFEIR